MKKLLIIFFGVFLLFGCSESTLSVDSFKESSEVYIFYKNIEKFSNSLPDENQHFIFDKLIENEKGYEMTYKVKDELCLKLDFFKDEQLHSISFGNISENKGFKYSELGILPTALILGTIAGDIEDENTKLISEFLLDCKKDEKLNLNDEIGKINLVKKQDEQIITITFEEIK